MKRKWADAIDKLRDGPPEGSRFRLSGCAPPWRASVAPDCDAHKIKFARAALKSKDRFEEKWSPAEDISQAIEWIAARSPAEVGVFLDLIHRWSP